jgi:hypothetical protein
MDRLATADQLRAVVEFLHKALEERPAAPAAARGSLYDAMPPARSRVAGRDDPAGGPDRAP